MTNEIESPKSRQPLLSLDAWAVIVALVLALAVRFDVIGKVPW